MTARLPRAVGVVRLSRHSGRDDDPSTSPVRQEKLILSDPTVNVVGWARDLGVSAAKIPPWARPELAEWLRRPDEWDTLVFWKLDRLVRSVGDFAEMLRWTQGQDNSTGLPPIDPRHPKNLISITDKLDLRTAHGKAMAQMTAVFAELEAAIIKERVNDARREMYSTNRWPGGKPPYGYKPEPLLTGGYRLVTDEPAAEILREFVRLATIGAPFWPYQCELDAAGVPTPRKGGSWRNSNIRKMLESRALLGEATYKAITTGEIAVDPVRAEPIISLSDWALLQEAMGKKERRQSGGASMVLDVAMCAECGSKMYKRPRNGYVVYGCGGRWGRQASDCTAARTIRDDTLHTIVERTLLNTVGDLEVTESRRTGGVDHSAEIADLSGALADLLDRSAGKGAAVAAVYQGRISELERRIEQLSAIPVVQPGVEHVGTGKTYREVWAAAGTDEGRRKLLLDSGVRVEVYRREPGSPVSVGLFERPEGYAVAAMVNEGDVTVWLYLPRDLAARVTGNLDAPTLNPTTRPLVTP